MGPRTPRLLAVALVVAATVAAGAGAALADTVGIHGVGLRINLPDHAQDGHPVLRLDRSAPSVDVEVGNSADAARAVRVYAVDVTEEDGAFHLQPEESADWVALDDRELRLEPGEAVTLSAPVNRHQVPDDVAYAAVVVERGTDTTVVTRAASVFHVRGQGAVPNLDLLVTAAVLLMGGVILGHLLRVRGRVEAFVIRSRRDSLRSSPAS